MWQGNCLTVMGGMPAECVDLIVTSPPYFVGKEYESAWTLEQYAALLLGFYREAFRILRPGRYAVVNFGDLHNSGGRMYPAEVPSVYPAGVAQWGWGREAGFDLQAARVWRKVFGRCAVSPVVNHRPRNVFDFEHVWTWRKPGADGAEWCTDRRLSQRGVLGDGWGSPAGLGRHCAAYPVELPSWAIQVHSREPGEVVLDPFAGSMTTLVAAHRLGRRGWGIELDTGYLADGVKRLEAELAQLTLLDAGAA